MRNHDRIDPRGNPALKRRKLDRLQPRAVSGDLRNAEMRIGGGVAVTRKMLDRGHHAGLVRAANISGDQFADLLGIFSEGTRVDDGIRGIRIDVGIRKEVPVNADGACLLTSDPAESLGIFCFSGCTKSHGVRESRSAMQAHGDSSFEIGGKQQRQL